MLDQVGLTHVADGTRPRFLPLACASGLDAAALLTKPRLLVLDQPFSNGLDPAGRHVHGVLPRLAAEWGPASCSPATALDDLQALCPEATILATWTGSSSPAR